MPDNKTLTPRELEILELVSSGASNRQIALALNVSVNTVKVHIGNILSKLGASSRTQAVMIGIQEGLIRGPSGAEFGNSGALTRKPADREMSFFRMWYFQVIIVVLVIAAIGLILLVLAPQFDRQGPQPTEPAVEIARWSTLAEMPTARSSMAITTDGSSLYAIGGLTESGVTGMNERYDPSNDEWNSLSTKPIPVYETQAIFLGGKIYVPGGRLDENTITDVLEVYDPIEDSWDQAARMPHTRSRAAIAPYEGKLYVFGGWDGTGFVDTTYIYDPATDSWMEGTALSSGIGYAGAVALETGILICGGRDEDQVFRQSYVYTPSLEDRGDSPWAERASMPTGLSYVSLANFGGFIYAIGSVETEGSPRMYTYLPTEDSWKVNDFLIGDEFSDIQAVGLTPNLYLLGGRRGSGFSDQVFSYQAIYTIVIPIVQ